MRKISFILFLILTVSVPLNGFVTAFSADREAVISDSIACAVMPFVFGAGLGVILLVWAPYSLLGGISILAVDLCVIAIRLGIMRKNEN